MIFLIWFTVFVGLVILISHIKEIVRKMKNKLVKLWHAAKLQILLIFKGEI